MALFYIWWDYIACLKNNEVFLNLNLLILYFFKNQFKLTEVDM